MRLLWGRVVITVSFTSLWCVCMLSVMRVFLYLFVRILGLWLIPVTEADSPDRTAISFSVTTNTGIGYAVFITGNHPDIGNWVPSRGAKLYWTPGNVWTGAVAIEPGITVEYKPVIIPLAVEHVCDPTQAQFIPPGEDNHYELDIPPRSPAPYGGKSIYYHSALTNVFMLYSIAGNAFTSAPLHVIAPGRSPGEWLHHVSGIGEAGASIEFVMSGWVGTNIVYDHAPFPGYGTPPAHNYFTTLDTFFIQDGDLFNYQPPAWVSPPSVVVSNVVSTHPPSPDRAMRIYLPRGYEENTWKRYPVLYMHDGENVFAPGGAFGSWDADITATREISQGRIRECIVVALDSTSNRTREYLPPEDHSGGQGFGDVYSRFLIYDVKTKIDAEFRTLPDRPNTLTAGSSSGGLIATYLGWHTNVFGKIGAFSPAYLISPNFNDRIADEPKQDLRLYVDMGTAGSPETLLVEDYWIVLDHWLRDGYVENEDLLSTLACGAFHNEAAWAARLPDCLRFLLSIWDEQNLLAHRDFVPNVLNISGPNSGISLDYPSLVGWTYQLESASEPDGTWSFVESQPPETAAWAIRQLTDTNSTGNLSRRMYRIIGY